MFGNGFSRRAIVSARVLRARLDSEAEPKLSPAARELEDVARWYHFQRSSGKYTFMCDALDGLELEDVVCFFALLAKREGIVHDSTDGTLAIVSADEPGGWRYLQDRDVESGGAVGLADAYARAHAAAGVTIHVQNSDDDATRVDFHVQDCVANAWADRHGSLDGGTWETSDDEGFVYDITYWRKGLFDELKKEGFRFDFSEYGEPEERDLEIAAHAAECETCQGDFRAAEEHWDDPLVMAAHHATGGKQ